MGYNDLTDPFEGLNTAWNDEEVNINTEEDIYNDMTKTTQGTPVIHWNTGE